MSKQRKVFRASKIAVAVATAIAAQGGVHQAYAGAGWGDNLDFFGQPIKTPTYYANSPSGMRKNANPYLNGGTGTVDTGTALRKFVDGLPGLGPAGANNLGQYLPLAVADTASYPGSDYYEIAVVEYTEKMHSDLPKGTTLRGYVQIETAANAASSKHVALTYPNGSPILDAAGNQIYAYDNPHYLGPVVLASKGRAVRFKFSNLLPLGSASKDATGKVTARNGDLFLPVDETLLGANTGPDGVTKYTQNRAEIHLHGGDSPWISDGTPHQWITPRGEATPLKKGDSVQNVPDMPDPGEGAVTYYYPNNQSARLMFYHDHTSGLTRINVYGGEAAGYVLLDNVEADLIARGVIPGLGDMIPLVIQDKTFVPADIAEQDARWDQEAWGKPGDLWFPHVYETNQDPNSFDGTNPVGRWDYGPWFWPVFPAPLALPTGVYGDVSTTPESFMDTPVVNGTAYPSLTVDPKAYRFRVLNAANDRFLNLGLYVADSAVTSADGRTNTEVKMVPASPAASPLAACAPGASPTVAAPCWPDYWPTDGRAEGVPDPARVGPDIIVIGNEGGLIPHPHVIPSTPVGYEMNRRSVTVLNILTSGLYLGSAERADVVIDFSQYAGKTLILYNDAPAPVPAFDPRIDYYTGNGDLTGAGGAESTKPGFGPNTRTIMQIKVAPARADGQAIAPFNVATLEAELPAAYGAGSEKPVVGQVAYNQSFGTHYHDNWAKIRTGSGQQPDFIWTPTDTPQALTSVQVTDGGVGYIQAPDVVISGGGGSGATATASIANGRVTAVTLTNPGSGYTSAPFVTFKSKQSGGLGATASVYTSATQRKTVQNKAIQELFDPNYGRMNATLGVELPFTTALTQTTVPLGYVDPATEIIKSGETQIWKITHNGVDTHPVHFHLMNVQLVNRIGWDGTIKPPSTSELGWKETIKMNPLEDIVVAVSPKTPLVPFGVPESTRYRDPAQAPNGTAGFTQIDFNQFLADGVTINPNFGLTVPGGTVKNTQEFYEWEYVWHCHILGHEENDFMRPLVFQFGALAPDAPLNPAATSEGLITWTDATPAADPLTMGNKKNEVGFRIERLETAAPAAGTTPTAPTTGYTEVGKTLANATSFTDGTIQSGKFYWYRVVAFNAKGEAASTAVSMTATDAGVTAAPTNVVATAVSSTVVNLTWTDNSSNESGFIIKRCVADAAGSCTGALTTLTTTAPNAVSYSDATAAANTTYVYQVIAHNAAGDSAPASSNVVSTLVAPANAPSNLAATAASDTSVSLSWKDNSSNENGFLVQRSANGGATWADVAGVPPLAAVPQNTGPALNVTVAANAVSFTDTGLTQNTTYLYRVASITAGGAATSTPVTVTTNYAAAPVVGPVTGSALWNQVSLSWPAVSPSTALTIQRTGGSGPAVSFTVAGTATQYVDTTVVQNTAYTYTVTAVNGPNTGTASAPFNVTTAYAAASALTGLSATINGTNQVTLGWTPAAASAYVTGVRVLRCVQSAANFNCTSPTSVFSTVYAFDKAAPTDPNTAVPAAWSDNSVLPSTDYTYQVYYVNGPNNGAAATANATVPGSFAIAAPLNFTATLSLGQSRVNLSWVDNSANETAFVVERSTDGVNFAQVATVASAAGTGTARTFSDTAVAPGTVYQYRVKAVNVAGAITTSSPYAGPVAVDMTIGAPSNLAATVSSTQVALSWTDNAAYETNFAVFRSADGGATWTQAGTATASAGTGGARTFTDNALTLIPGQTYSYYVVARWVFNGVTYASAQSSQATAAIAPLPAPTNAAATFSATQVTLTWRDNAANETRYEVQRSADGGATWGPASVVAARAGTGGTVTFADPVAGLTAGTTYQYQVTAVNVTGTVTTVSAPATATVPYAVPAAPASANAVAGAVGSLTITVSWSPVPFATGYTIERARVDNLAPGALPVYAAWTTVNGTTTSRDNTGLTAGRAYQYRVRANNALGSSAFIETVAATVQ
jgi:FtsP/CotA-like multicopper oxidase with cupredoxin domain/fibronectin type 3 domain-containing protein